MKINIYNTTKVTINGKTKIYEGPITIVNGKIISHGKVVDEVGNIDSKDKQPIIIKIEGDVDKIENVSEVHVTGEVKGNIHALGSVHVEKDCHGDIDSTGDVTINGNYQNIDTNGNVTVDGNCQKIDTTGNVRVNGNCAGKIDTMGNVYVGNNNKKW